ncbi:MAG: NAD(P)H-hydrate dehydratase [Thermoplasmata archaeon]|nr:NAD(P)H-hydrate dehydratase [Thermoplasmata archaeon]
MVDRPLSAREIRVIETNAIALGATIDSLMENAGRAVAEEAVRNLPPAPAHVAVVAGTGKNGGDGFAAAHYLGQWGYTPQLWVVRAPAEIRSGATRRCYERVAHHHPTRVGIPTAAELAGCPLLLDALLGIGQAGALRSPYREAVEAVNASGAPVLSIDIASGLGTDVAVRPRWTVTFTAPKEGMSSENSGAITVRDIGIPEAARREAGPGEFHLYPVPHGARSVRVVVVGGGPFAGAPALTAAAALRAGAERATILAPHPAAGRIQAFSPNLVVRTVGEEHFRPTDLEPLLEELKTQHPAALALGMGAGRDPETLALFSRLVAELDRSTPVLVDADALEAAYSTPPRAGGAPLLLTPNEGELHRLFPELPEATEARIALLRAHASKHAVSWLAKGEPDVIVAATGSYVNRHHTPAASVSGAGDVLAGVAAFLLGSGLSGLEAARLASYWVGDTGRNAQEAMSFGVVATDLLERLPLALKRGLDGIRETGG